jgi:cytochrome c-type biogenesis protein CcmE
MSNRGKKLLAGGVVILAALGYLIYSSMRTAVVYFVTPAELVEQGAAARSKALRLGGMVEQGSLQWNPRTLDLRFRLTDGKTSVAVAHKGTPPDLFAEGKGAVVEGRVNADGSFAASAIMAKHSEEYRPPKAGEMPVFQKGRYQQAPGAPATTGAPAATGAPATTRAPAATEVPATTRAPAATGTPAAAGAPAAPAGASAPEAAAPRAGAPTAGAPAAAWR